MNGRHTRGILQLPALCSFEIGDTVSETVDGFCAVFLVCHGELRQIRRGQLVRARGRGDKTPER